ncbi:MAG TPA: hypothetical protein VHB79_33015 [Polyangiaceae bacterium]|nr:hypothetical protein [Polyangiaceae bacterium]
MTRNVVAKLLLVGVLGLSCKREGADIDNWQGYAKPSSSQLDAMQLSSARRVALETATLAMGSRNAPRLKQLNTWVRERAQTAVLEPDDLTALELAIACLEHPDSTPDALQKLDALRNGKLRTPARDVCEHPAAH